MDRSGKNKVLRRPSTTILIILLVIQICAVIVYAVINSDAVGTAHTTDTCSGPPPKPIPTIKSRRQVGNIILEHEKLEIGAELGVYRGDFSLTTLSRWPSCKKYVLVDLWGHQENYKDNSNLQNEKHSENYRFTMSRLSNYSKVLEVCQNYTTVCATRYPDNFFDFIYVDARHDYKGVLVDLHTWWPKLKRGGIIGGHDYVTQNDGPMQSGQDWTINFDGTRDKLGRAVKGAVDEFASSICRQVVVTYRDLHYNTWLIRK